MARAKRFEQNNNSNAVCYYRYSSDSQREVSIDQQREAAERYCKEHGYHIIKEYEDRAISGTRIDRPQLQLMLKEVKKIRPAYLILWKTDRLSRDRIDAAIAKGILRDYGVKIEYVAENMPEDEAERVLLEGIEETLAAHFIIQHSKNVTRGLNYNAERALYNGRKILGYKGQPNQKYEIDSATAQIVQRIFNDYASGKPMKVIADELNLAGFKTVRGNCFTEKSLWHTLHNRAYIGEYKWGDIVVPDGFPPLVSNDIFDKVQEMMEKNKHGGRGGRKKLKASSLEGIDFWLTGKLVCGECGSQLSGTSGTSKSGQSYYYYGCSNHKKHMCNMKNVKKNEIEEVIAYILDECINDSAIRVIIANKVYEYYMREFASDDSYEKSLILGIKDVDRKLDNFLKAIESGIINDTTQQRMKELEERKRLYNDELIAERNRQKYSLKPEHVIRYLESFVGNLREPSLRDKVLDYLVQKIYVFSDKVVINFYYSDDNREISLEEFKSYLENLDRIQKIMDNTNCLQNQQEQFAESMEDLLSKYGLSEKESF